MEREKKYQPTLKGFAVLAAIDAGLCEKNAEGYNISNFLKFWSEFEKHISFNTKTPKQTYKKFILGCLISAIIGCLITRLLCI